MPLYYTWSRSNGPIPAKVQYLDEGRTLLIPNAQLEDSGNYTCRVQQGSRSFENKTIALVVEGERPTHKHLQYRYTEKSILKTPETF